jgi:hypothetical protein
MHRFGDRLEKRSEHPGEICLGVLDGEAENEKFEIVVCPRESSRASIELRLVYWGEGVGWYVQRTMPLPADLAGLRALLRRAQRLASGNGAYRQRAAGSRLLTLPPPAGKRQPT